MTSSRASIRILATGWRALHRPRVPFATIVLEHLINETTRLKLVEVSHSDPKHSLAELFNDCLVHFMLLNKLQDEFPLLVATLPSLSIGMTVETVTSIDG